MCDVGLNVEGLFRLSGGNPARVEQLKATWDKTGDADLEACADVASVASLLKLWLRDLPEPLVTPAVTAELVTLLHSKWPPKTAQIAGFTCPGY